jgi:hypothetical protein
MYGKTSCKKPERGSMRYMYGMFTQVITIVQYIINGAYLCIKAQYRSLRGKGRDFSEQVEALTICNTCEYREKDKCGICGCILGEKVKDPDSSCPIGKW